MFPKLQIKFSRLQKLINLYRESFGKRGRARKSLFNKNIRTGGPGCAGGRSHLLYSELPVIRYWGNMRHPKENGLPPSSLPRWHYEFDWLIGFEHGWQKPGKSSGVIFCHPNFLELLCRYAKTEIKAKDEPQLPILLLAEKIGDCPHRILAQFEISRVFFSKVYYEAYDTDEYSVSAMPIGFEEIYLRGFEKAVLTESSVAVSVGQREKLLLAAWGEW